METTTEIIPTDEVCADDIVSALEFMNVCQALVNDIDHTSSWHALALDEEASAIEAFLDICDRGGVNPGVARLLTEI